MEKLILKFELDRKQMRNFGQMIITTLSSQQILGTVESQETRNTELTWRLSNGKKRTSES